MKLKENVDLKVLEELGFEYDEFTERYCYDINYYNPLIDIIPNRAIHICCKPESKYYYLVEIKIKDLIEKGLVEEVEND